MRLLLGLIVGFFSTIILAGTFLEKGAYVETDLTFGYSQTFNSQLQESTQCQNQKTARVTQNQTSECK